MLFRGSPFGRCGVAAAAAAAAAVPCLFVFLGNAPCGGGALFFVRRLGWVAVEWMCHNNKGALLPFKAQGALK